VPGKEAGTHVQALAEDVRTGHPGQGGIVEAQLPARGIAERAVPLASSNRSPNRIQEQGRCFSWNPQSGGCTLTLSATDAAVPLVRRVICFQGDVHE
jgi:hypothetical protein